MNLNEIKLFLPHKGNSRKSGVIKLGILIDNQLITKHAILLVTPPYILSKLRDTIRHWNIIVAAEYLQVFGVVKETGSGLPSVQKFYQPVFFLPFFSEVHK